MHLVDEQHGFLATRHQPFVSAREHITHVFDTGGTADSSSNTRPDCPATMVASVVLPTPGGPNRITELGAVRLPLLAGLARRCKGDPCPSTWVWPMTSSSVRGRMRTANGRVIDSGASAAPNKSFSLIVFYTTPLFEQTFELSLGSPQSASLTAPLREGSQGHELLTR